MEMMKLVTGILLTGLVVYCLLSFGINIAKENDSPVNIEDESAIGNVYANLTKNINIESISEDTTHSWENTTQSQGSTGDLFFGSIKNAGTVIGMTSMTILKTFRTLFDLIIPDSLIATFFLALFGIIIIFLGWRLLKVGY